MITLLIFSIISTLVLIYSIFKFGKLCEISPKDNIEKIETRDKQARYIRISLWCLSIILIYIDKLVFDAVGFGRSLDSSIWCGLLYIFSCFVWIMAVTPLSDSCD